MRNENTLLPATLDNRQVSGLLNEVIAKLNNHKPASIGRASHLWRHACGHLHSAGVAKKNRVY
ncbi:hypothetical protein ACLK19_25180 [Escherichia coli]